MIAGASAVATAASILADRSERQRIARIARASQHKVLLNLRVSGDTAEILDAAASCRGETIDEYIERFVRSMAG